jgi:hypothetical protein
MKTYTVLTAVTYGTTEKNAKRYPPGSEIELEDEDAKPLLDVKAIKATEPEAKAKK